MIIWNSYCIPCFSFWDSVFDDDLLDNKVTLNLLFVQVKHDVVVFVCVCISVCVCVCVCM